jgi:O-antigen/teichoic acid export membrane protein
MTGDGSLVRKTVVGATWMVLWRFLTRVLGFASTLLLARLLVPADFGLVAMASTFAAAVDALSELGVQDALVRHPRTDRKLLDTAFTLQVIRAAITAGVVGLGAPLAAAWFNEPRLESLLLVLAGASFIAGLENIGTVDFRRDMRFDKMFLLLAVPRVLQLATTIPLALATESYWSLILGTAVSKVARTVMSYIMHPHRPTFCLARWRDLTSFTAWTWATSVAKFFWDRGDAVILGPALGPARLGGYLLAFEMAILPVTELISPAADALFSGFASAQRQGTDSAKLALSVATALLLIITPMVIAISCASGYLVAGLLGPRWAEVQPLVAILAWQCLFSPVNYVCGAVLVANGLVRRNFIVSLTGAAVKFGTLIVTVALTDRLELVALAIVATMAVECAAFTVMLKIGSDLRLRSAVPGVARILLAGAVTIFVLYQAGLAWEPVVMPSVPALLYCALIGMIALAVFWPVVLLLWLLAGRPPGPEAILLDFASRHLAPRVMRRLTFRSVG